MAYDGWLVFAGQEIANRARLIRLSQALGIDAVRLPVEDWLEGMLTDNPGFGLGPFGMGPFGSPSEYADVTTAPWYDAQVPASLEFAGFLPLSVRGLDDSTYESTPVEYITDGGHSGYPRHATKDVVVAGTLVASTERGAEYGRKWLSGALRSQGQRTFCSGGELHFLRYRDASSPFVYHRDVRLTRGVSITHKRSRSCYSLWGVTFTLNAADPYEYELVGPVVTGMGLDETVTGPHISWSGRAGTAVQACPSFSYEPVYDPLHPALEAPPVAPDFYPEGWRFSPGFSITRFFARVNAPGSSALTSVPVIKLRALKEARHIRVAVWPPDVDYLTQCDPLFVAIVSYLPPGADFYIDGEQKVSYLWESGSPYVRRTDSLVYGPNAQPVDWTAFTDKTGLLFTLDVPTTVGDLDTGDVEASLTLVPKSD